MSFRIRNTLENAGMIPCMSNVLVAQGGDSVCASLEKSFAWHPAWSTGEVWEHKFILIQQKLTKLTQGIIFQMMSLCKAATLISQLMPCNLLAYSMWGK